MPTDTKERINELLEVLKKNGSILLKTKDGKTVEDSLNELGVEINSLKKKNKELEDKSKKSLTVEEFVRRLGGETNFDDKGVYKGGTASTSDNQQPKPTPQPNEPDEKPQPNDPWFVTGLSGLILTNAKNNYQPTDIINGKYQNIQLITGDATEKENILNWRKAFANDIPPYNGYNLGDIDSNGQYKGRNIDGKSKSQIDTEIANEIKKTQETQKATQLLNEINSQTDDTKLPDDNVIKTRYDDTLLDSQYKYASLIKARDEKRLTILKEKELVKYNKLKADIEDPKLNTFLLLPENFKADEIQALDNSLLPQDKQKETLTQLIKDKRATFKWKINVEANEVQGDGMKEADYQEANTKRQNEWKVETRGKLDADTFNKFLMDNDVKLPLGDAQITKDITEELKSKDLGGYDTNDETAEETKMTWGDDTWITKEITVNVPGVGEKKVQSKEPLDGKTLYAIEESWDIKGKGGLLLPYAYKKADWNPDNPTFCQFKEVPSAKDKTKMLKVVNDTTLDPAKRKELFGDENAIPGHLPLVTGGGKTTKMICDLCNGGNQNVVLVCPDWGLANSGFKNHDSWLQNYGCPNHKLNPREVMEDFVEKDEQGNEKIVQRKVVRYDNHGTYQVAFNDVITQKVSLANKDAEGNDIEGSEEEKWGVSVMDIDHFRGFITRNVFTTTQTDTDKLGKEFSVIGVNWLNKGKDKKFAKLKPSKVEGEPGETQPEITENEIREIKQKKIPKGTIIVFDEAHLSRPDDYQELIKDTITMTDEKREPMFRVIKMSATFKGKPFSITTTFPRTNLYMNYVPESFNTELQSGVTQVFLKDVNNVNVKALTAKNIPHLIVNQTNEANYESITYGMPDGSLVIVDNTRQEGYTPHIKNVFCTGWTQTPILDSSKWEYEIPDKSRISLSSNLQQGGRVSRKWKGTWVNLFPLSELQEAQMNEKRLPIAVKITRDLLTGTKLFMKDTQILRAGFALPGDSAEKKGKFGLPPEALAMGLAGDINTAEKFVRIYFNRDMSTLPNKDENLWKKHLLTWEPAPLDEKEAQEILKLMTQTYINTDKEFPTAVHALIKTALIQIVDKKGKGEFRMTPEIVEQVLHKCVNEKLYELDPELKDNPNKVEWKGDQKDIFDKIVGLYRMAKGANCDVPLRPVDKNKPDGDQQLVIEVDYPKRVTMRIVVTESEEERALKNEMRLILEEAGLDIIDEVRKVFESDALERYRILAIKLRTSPLCNEVIDLIGTGRANELDYKLRQLENDLKELQLQANIEANKG